MQQKLDELLAIPGDFQDLDISGRIAVVLMSLGAQKASMLNVEHELRTARINAEIAILEEQDLRQMGKSESERKEAMGRLMQQEPYAAMWQPLANSLNEHQFVITRLEYHLLALKAVRRAQEMAALGVDKYYELLRTRQQEARDGDT